MVTLCATLNGINVTKAGASGDLTMSADFVRASYTFKLSESTIPDMPRPRIDLT